jgi:hypothetical protein
MTAITLAGQRRLTGMGSQKSGQWHQDRRSGRSDRQVRRPYSPDLNPIEMAFAKLKTLLRQVPERSASAPYLDQFTP